jgi:SAM-dependent methyltransferase
VSRYVIRGGREGRERLRILAGVMRPTTLALFERAGIGPGMRCLDVGCAGGDVTFDLAERVGPAGGVVGVDLDATKLEIGRAEARGRGLGHVEFRIADAQGGHGVAEFDVVYARFLLTHLADPAGALASMRRALRPGGTLVVEDIDFRGHFCEPDAPAFRRYVALYTEAVARRGADANIGPRLPALLRSAGLDGVTMHVVQPAGIDGDVKLIAAITAENIVDAVLAEGLADRADLDRMIRDLHDLAHDGRTVMSVPRVVQCWGRTPSSA